MNVDVVVSGRSVPALLAALDFAQVGLSVLVTEDQIGHEPPRQPIADAEGHVRRFLKATAAPIEGSGSGVNTAVLPVDAPGVTTVLRDTRNEWAPLADPNVLGIPATPLDAAVLRLIGTKAALRAYVDRIRPVLTLGKTKALGDLVRQRMGEMLRERIVDPLIIERFGVSSTGVDVALAAPGLNEALTRQGSLSTAVLEYVERYDASEKHISPAGGGSALKAELLRKLDLYNAKIVSTTIESANRSAESWTVTLADGAEVNSRAFVIDFGRSAVVSPLAQRVCEQLVVTRTRVHASCTVSRPAGITNGQSALAQVADWSLRITPDSAHTAAVTAISDVRSGEVTVEPSSQEILTLLTEAKLTLANEETLVLGVASAPFATHEQRDHSMAAISAAIEADPMLLPVGRSLYGDDLGHALHEAEVNAVTLRRRLLGLID